MPPGLVARPTALTLFSVVPGQAVHRRSEEVRELLRTPDSRAYQDWQDN